MKISVRKILIILCFAFIISSVSWGVTFAQSPDKSILIITDTLDFSIINQLDIHHPMSLGLMNTRSSDFFHKSQEGYFMSIATGRRVKLKEGLFQGIKQKPDGQLVIEGYENVLQGLDEQYQDFSKEMDFLGHTFPEEGIGIGYIGNDESALLAANKQGVIPKGTTEIQYDIQWLGNQTQEILIDTEILILSYDIDSHPNSIEILQEYINRYSTYNIMVFPKGITGDMKDIRNSTLVPFLYHSPQENPGILTSLSTKRQGMITNMDVFPHLSSMYNVSLQTSIGQDIYAEEQGLDKGNILETNYLNFKENLNGIVIKYIFHGLIIFIQLYIFYNMLKGRKKNLEKYHYSIQGIFIGIFLSLLLGVFRLKQSVILYCSIIIGLTLVFLFIEKKRNIVYSPAFPIGTNILLLWSIYFNPNMIYQSFFGFNNLVSGGRFYGFNNETMGILLVTSIITFFWVKNKINHRYVSSTLLLVYFPIVINALTSDYGSNFGGSLASIAVFFIVAYTTFLKKAISRKNTVIVLAIGLSIFIFSFFIDSSGHAGSFFQRVELLGMYEFMDMLGKKVRQLVLTAIAPPWSIIFISQLYFIKRMVGENREWIKKVKEKNPHIIEEMFIMFISALFVFVLNDTGVTAFVYMVTYLIGRIFVYLLTNDRDIV